MNNRRNQRIYRWWAPVYDLFIRWPLFTRGRRRALELLCLLPGESVLLSGVGTGMDLPLLPSGAWAVGADLSQHMLRRARAKLAKVSPVVEFIRADAGHLPVADEVFDVAVLTLILSVVPDPRAALGEALRVVKPGGRIVVFDKFLPEGTRPSWKRESFNRVTRFFGTDINRSWDAIREGSPCAVQVDESMGLSYRVILLQKLIRPKMSGNTM